MKITIVTLFPEFFESFQKTSIIKRAIEKQLVQIETVNFREYTLDKHHISYRTCISDYSFTLSKTVIKDALQSHLPSVILCSSTKQLLASYHCVKELGLRIPEDISICGFGGYEYSEVLSPSLTSIQFDAKLSGNVGAKTMLSMINEEDVETTQMIPFEFHEGNSVLDKMKG